jgi:hypothetical protein
MVNLSMPLVNSVRYILFLEYLGLIASRMEGQTKIMTLRKTQATTFKRTPIGSLQESMEFWVKQLPKAVTESIPSNPLRGA